MNNPHRHPNQEEAPPFFEPILEYYNNLPPVTRTWFSLSLLITTLNTLDILPDYQLIFIWDRVKSPHLELWRILTSFSWAGPGTLVDFPVLFLLYSMILSGSSYEMNPHEASYQGTRQRRGHHTMSDCLFAILCCSLLIVGSYLLVVETTLLNPILHAFDLDQSVLQPVFTRTLEYAILTLDSFRNPDRQVNINFFPVQGRHVPLFHLGFGLLMGYRINEIVHGIIVAFVYVFLITEDNSLAAMMGRRRLIYTPQLILQLFGEELDDGSSRENITIQEGGNVLHHAAKVNDLSVFQRQLEELESVLNSSSSSLASIAAASAPFRQQDINGWQPLHEAARGGHIDILKLLLEIPDNIQNDDGRVVRRRGNKLKVDINARTNNGRGCTALWLAEENHGAESDVSQLLRNNGGISLGYDDDPEEENTEERSDNDD
eukprot:CCRYP_007659-RB/>CCRYP_007659-RB protein AED:0.13 eAED:0.13 QI:185/1/1/1/0.5/0.33/3/2170/431